MGRVNTQVRSGYISVDSIRLGRIKKFWIMIFYQFIHIYAQFDCFGIFHYLLLTLGSQMM